MRIPLSLKIASRARTASLRISGVSERNPGAQFHITKAFNKARVRGRVSKDIIDTKGRVTIRLQGVDAPELHYMPQAAKKKGEQTKEQRKIFLVLESQIPPAARRVGDSRPETLLEGGGTDSLACRVVTAVDQPDDAIDTYGRLVGDIEVTLNGKDVNLNQWLMFKGWTVPSFYNSMSADEIQTLLKLGEEARKKKRGFWPHLMKTVGTLNFKLRYRKSAPAGDKGDTGPVLMPKLFRRLSTFAVNKKAKMVTGGFKAYVHYGLKKLGVEKLKPIFTRGVLLDIASFKGRMLDKGEEITIADVQGAMTKQGLTDLKQGDAVLINTGWGTLWMKDNARFDSGAPGIGLEVAKWLVGKQIAYVGSDTWPVEVNPNPDPDVRGVVHQELTAKNGIFLHENLDGSERPAPPRP